MEPQTRQIMQECTARSDSGTLTFPEVVKKLMDAGVEQYHADLLRSEKTYYMPDGESCVTPADRASGQPQTFERLGTGDLVNQVAINVDKAGPILVVRNKVIVPDLIVQRSAGHFP